MGQRIDITCFDVAIFKENILLVLENRLVDLTGIGSYRKWIKCLFKE